MGYNTWNDLGCSDMTEANVKHAADSIISTGLRASGYEYINLDDCWQSYDRDSVTGRLQGDPNRFPSGMKVLGDYIHGLGLKFGIYTDRGSKTCAGFPGSLGHEDLDAQTFADWGVDYVKEDNCYSSTGPNDKDTLFTQFALFRDGLNKTGRPVFFSVCGGGDEMPWGDIRYYATDPRGGSKLANSWRISPDAVEGWTMQDAALSDAGLAEYAGLGGFNDPDMLLGSTTHATRTLPIAWSRTQFNVWAILMAPLLIGAPPGTLSATDLETYKNTEVIAVNQDPLSRQGRVVEQWGLPLLPWSKVIWARDLSEGNVAMVFVNGGWLGGEISCSPACWSKLPFQFGTHLHVRDLWAHADAEVPIAVAGSTYLANIPGGGASRMFKLTPMTQKEVDRFCSLDPRRCQGDAFGPFGASIPAATNVDEVSAILV